MLSISYTRQNSYFENILDHTAPLRATKPLGSLISPCNHEAQPCGRGCWIFLFLFPNLLSCFPTLDRNVPSTIFYSRDHISTRVKELNILPLSCDLLNTCSSSYYFIGTAYRSDVSNHILLFPATVLIPFIIYF